MPVASPEWPRTIGIVGGLGPYAHIEFERLVLEAAAARLDRPACDQDFPPWVLVSVPQTPDRTQAVAGMAPDPVPQLSRAIECLASSADFAVMPCNTAHVYLEALRTKHILPIMDIIDETVAAAESMAGRNGRIGLLATTGTLRSRLFEDVSRRRQGPSFVSLLTLPSGGALQESLVMEPIYGPLVDGKRAGGGLKSGRGIGSTAGDGPEARLREAAEILKQEGAELIVLGCTEIPLAIGRTGAAGLPLLDTMAVAANVAVAIAAGERPLPEPRS